MKTKLTIGLHLPEDFYLQETAVVAEQLLGKGLVVGTGTGLKVVQIVETEAYLEQDPASHSHCGRTDRNSSMFGPPGSCYVYLSYGINYCMNVVTRPIGCGEAVLIRAAAPLCGLEEMARNRGLMITKNSLNSNDYKQAVFRELLSGPGKLTQALGLDLRYDGCCFNRDDFKLVALGGELSKELIGRSPRVGITKATTEHLRFFIKSSPWLSRKG